MTADRYIIILSIYSFSFIRLVCCQLNLNEDFLSSLIYMGFIESEKILTHSAGLPCSPCVTKGLNGTCVGIFRCDTAALTYLYTNAGFDAKIYRLPEFPEICSYKDKEPVVCCTDCELQKETYRDTVVGPYGSLEKREEGTIAKEKCYEYFSTLPYICRFPGGFDIKTIWEKEQKCYQYEYEHYVDYVAGGRNAVRWEFPHMALLGYGDDVETAQWLCGGSVISERFILTAAHCTSTRALGNITFAALGLLKRTDPQDLWKIYEIKRIVIHPEYKSPSKYHDIALLVTNNEITFGRDLLPACLNVGLDPIRIADASGWGRLGHRKDLADTLQVVSLEEFNETECSGIYKPHRHLLYGYDHEKQMCFGDHTEVVDTCEGDSGGPLHVNDNECQFIVVGVTSYGKDCGILGSPGMYTRVSYYVPWIESVVWPEETEERKQKDNQWLDKWLN